jgi:hypothetical protein
MQNAERHHPLLALPSYHWYWIALLGWWLFWRSSQRGHFFSLFQHQIRPWPISNSSL